MTPETEAPYLDPLRSDMAATESRITELEGELSEQRAKRTALGRALSVLDPFWAAEHGKAAAKPKGKSTYIPTQKRVQSLLDELPSFNGSAFTAADITEKTGIHLTTVHKILKQLHDDGRVQLDHMGGQRKTTKFFRLIPQD